MRESIRTETSEKDDFYYFSLSGNALSVLSSGYVNSSSYPFYLSFGKRVYITKNHGMDFSLCAATSRPYNIYAIQSLFLYKFSSQIYFGPQICTGVYFPMRHDTSTKKIIPTLGVNGIVGYEFPFGPDSSAFSQLEVSGWDLFYKPKAVPFTTKVNLGFGF